MIKLELRAMIGIQEDEIMGGCLKNVIRSLESPQHCVDGEVLEHNILKVHRTLGSFGDSTSIDNCQLEKKLISGSTRGFKRFI